MSEDNYNDKRELQVASNKIWNPINILRGVIPVEHSHVYLFLLSGYYDQVFEMTMFDWNNSWHEPIYKAFKSQSGYNELSDVYFPILNSIPENKLRELLYELSMLDLNMSKKEFNEIFDNLIFKLTDSHGKLSGQFLLPLEISQFVMDIANVDERSKVFNPFAGLASFATYLKNDQSYYGQEISRSTWGLGKLRLMRQQSNIEINYCLEDSVHNWPESSQFDLVVSNPPFNFKIDKYFADYNWNRTTMNAEQYVLKKGLESIRPNGKVISVASQSSLFKGGFEKTYRKQLVEDGFIDTVISLPGGLLRHTRISICILILTKVKNDRNSIRFIDATGFVIKEGQAKKRLDNENLLAYIKSGNNSEFIKEIDVETIKENDFNLSVNRYFIKPVEGKKLSQFASFNPGYTFDDDEQCKFVQIKDLKDNVFDCELNIDTLEVKETQENKTIFIDKPCILMATVGNYIKPTYFAYKEEEPIALGSGIIAVEINQNEVNPFFLINEFSAVDIQNQLKGYRVGAFGSYIKVEDLKNLVFEIPPLKEQNAKIEEILSQRVKDLELERDNLIHGRKIEETDSSTSLSHVLGKPLLSIGSSLEIIQDVMGKVDPNWKDIVINESRQFKMSDAFESIIKNINYIQELVDDNTSLVNVSNFPLTELGFIKFLTEFIKNERKSMTGNVILALEVHADIKQMRDKEIIVRGNEQRLKIVLFNLLDNIRRHAFMQDLKLHEICIEVLPFIGNKDEAKELNYEINSNKSYIEVKVSNTGKPFAADLTLDDYIRKNFSVGFAKNKGLGGYEINEILKVHNYGKKALNILKLDEDHEFSSTVSFIIPIL